MATFERTTELAEWLDGLSDQRARARVPARIVSAELGNFGDCASVGEGVVEMRVHFGPGYRVYFVRHGRTTYLLLCGGIKRGQGRDIMRAIEMAREL